jgi:hypothetical protein
MTANMMIKKNLIGFEPISKGFYKIRFKERFTNITMLFAHAMTREKDKMEKKQAGNGQRLSGKRGKLHWKPWSTTDYSA